MATEDLIREAQDPSTSAARLAELVQADPATWASVAVHPAAYPGLLQWLSERNDAATNVALSSRAAAAATPTPTEIQSPAPVEQTAPIEATAPIEPVEQTAPIEATPPVEQTASFEQTTPIEQTAPIEQAYQAPAPAAAYAPAAAATSGATPPQSDKRNFWVLAGMVAVVLVLIGGIAFGATKVFGGDDEKDEPVAAQTSDSGDTPTPDSESTDAPTTDDSGDGDADAFCGAMKEVQDVSLNAMPSGGGTPNLDDLKDMASKMTAAYENLEDAAPDELKSDVKVMSSFLEMMSDPTSADPKAMTDNMEKYTQAATKLSSYYVQNCS